MRIEITETQGRLTLNVNIPISDDPYYKQKIEAMGNGLRALANANHDNQHLRNSVLTDTNNLTHRSVLNPTGPSMRSANNPAPVDTNA